MIRIPCPTIYCGGSVGYAAHQDSQGDGVWSTSYTTWEPTEQDCACEHNGEQEMWLDAQLDIAIADYEPDYSWMEDV